MYDYFTKKSFEPRIEDRPSENLNICVVLPSFNEPDIEKSLNSLQNCKLPVRDVEVIVVVNHPEGSSSDIVQISENAISLVKMFNQKSKSIKFHPIQAFDLPRKHAGVGYARQIGCS